MHDAARRDQLRVDACVAAHYAVLAEHLCQQRFVFDSVLYGEYRTAGIETCLEGARGGRRIVRFDAKQDEVVGGEVTRIVGRSDRDREVPLVARELQALIFECAQVFAARAKDHLLTGLLQARAEIGADCARAHHEDLHHVSFIGYVRERRSCRH